MSSDQNEQKRLEYLTETGLYATEKYQTHQYLEQHNAILKSIASGKSLNEIMLSTVSLLASQFKGMPCSILLLDNETQTLQHGASMHLSNGYIKAIDGVKIGPNEGSCGTAAFERCAVIVEDISTDARWENYKKIAETFNLKSCWSVPIMSNSQKVYGTFAVYSHSQRTPYAGELEIMESASSVLSLAIERDIGMRDLQKSNAMMDITYTYAAAGITINEIDGRFMMANPAYCKMMGYTLDELKLLTFINITHPDDIDNYQKIIEQLKSGKIEQFVHEKRNIHKDGSTIWVKVTGSISQNNKELTGNLIVITDDITEMKKLEFAYHETQSLLTMANNAAHIGGWSVDAKTMALTLSKEAIAIHEEPEDFNPSVEQAINYYAPESIEKLKTTFESCLFRGQSFDEEYEFITAKGRRIWVRSLGQAIRDSQNNIVRAEGALIDISDRKKEIQDKLNTLNRLEKIASRLPGMVYEFRLNPDGTMTLPYASEYIQQIYNLKPEEVKDDASPVFKWIHPEDLAELHQSIQTSATQLTPLLHEYRLRYDDGRIKWILGSSMPYRQPDGAVVWYGFITDITESRQSQEHLSLLESCVSRLNDIVLITEAEPVTGDGPKITFVNDAFERRTGYSREEVIGKSPRILQGAKTQRDDLDRIHQALDKWEPVRAELINYKKNGEEFWLELDIVPIADKTGWYTHWLAVERDITLRKQSEIELKRLNRALMMRNAMSNLINQANNESQLLSEACQLTTDVGGYATAWVGYKIDDALKSIQRMAVSGSASEYILSIELSWCDKVPQGQGPAGRCIRNGVPIVVEDFTKDSAFAFWLEKAKKYDLTGVITLPLKNQSETFGLLSLFMNEVNAIGADEIKLLTGLADDLAFGIMTLRTIDIQKRGQQAINKVAESVSAISGSAFITQLNNTLQQSMEADIALIARFLPGEPLSAKTLSVILRGQTIDNFEYLIAHTPFEQLLDHEVCIIPDDLHIDYPETPLLQSVSAQAYIACRLLNSDGNPLGVISLYFTNPPKETEYLLATLKIFAARAAAELERQDTDRRLVQQASLLDKAQDAILVRSLDHKILYWNKGAERLYGWTSEEAVHQSIDLLLYDDPTVFYRFTKLVLELGEWKGEIQQKRKDGSSMIVEGHWTLVHDNEGRPESILAINTDISLRKVAQKEIQYLAYYDALTDLPNKQFLIEKLKQVVLAYDQTISLSALLFIDLDNFKTLNDTLGHGIGDLLLKEAAIRIKSALRSQDIVARFGGDEFVILVTELSTDETTASMQVQRIVEKIVATLNLEYQLDSHTYYSTASIGIALIEALSSYEDILKHADLAMYQAKNNGRNTVCFYSADMKMAITNRVLLEEDLKRAILNQEFSLHYQPQVDHNNRILGAEALIRWTHPKRGMVSPFEFIPVAEETKLILPIGEWVMRTACQQLVKWSQHESTAALTIAVNVSIQQFLQQNFVQQVLAIFQETKVNPTRLKLEITESMLVDNVEDIIKKMKLLKEHGVQFSLDDFGTGYSSLAYLKKLPLYQLKIDQSFVRDILIDANDASISKAIITLAHNLGLSVIAEGVETDEQRQFLLNNECSVYQGYYFSKPVPIEKFNELLLNKIVS